MKFNKLNLITTLCFVVGFILILFNSFTNILNIIATGFFMVGCVLLTISFYFHCKKKNAILSSENEEVIMELSLEDGMEQYVPVEKKQTGFKNFIENARIFSPCVLSGLLAVCLIILFVFSII